MYIVWNLKLSPVHLHSGLVRNDSGRLHIWFLNRVLIEGNSIINWFAICIYCWFFGKCQTADNCFCSQSHIWVQIVVASFQCRCFWFIPCSNNQAVLGSFESIECKYWVFISTHLNITAWGYWENWKAHFHQMSTRALVSFDNGQNSVGDDCPKVSSSFGADWKLLTSIGPP